MLPEIHQLMNLDPDPAQIAESLPHGLLTRPAIDLDPAPIRALVKASSIVITGAGGSIGAELSRQIANFKPSRLVLLDRSERGLFEIERELTRRGASPVALIADVTDPKRIDAVMKAHTPDIVFHAAAHKHVPLMEANPCEAVKNNIRGTRVVAEAAERHHVGRFILISSDKAVNPVSVMGATKRVAELLLRKMGRTSRTRFATVRFGNVLGSSGSVVPQFLHQIKTGGPLTVTHPDMYRYFMLIGEAALLVLHAASAVECSSTYILEMGKPIRILDIAKGLAELARRRSGKEIGIEFIGARPGEKLCEEMIDRDETAAATRVKNVMMVQSALELRVDFLARLRILEDAALDENAATVTPMLRELAMTNGRGTEQASERGSSISILDGAHSSIESRARILTIRSR